MSRYARAFAPRIIPFRFRVIITLFAIGAALALTADGARLQAQSLALGDENSWIRIQNVSIRPATIEISFYDADGNAVATDGCPRTDRCTELAKGAGWTFHQQVTDELEAGYRGSAIVTVDRPFVTLVGRDAFKDGVFQIGGDTLRLGAGTSMQYAPLVQNDDLYVSRLSIQNVSEDRDACIEVRYYAEGSLTAIVIDPLLPTAGCPNGGNLVTARASLIRDENTLPVPAGFTGSAVVLTHDTASGVSAEDQQPALVVDTRERHGPGFATYRAFDHVELSRVVLLPLVDRNASEGQSTTWTTRFRIMNGDPSTPNEVTLLFEGEDGQGDRIEIEHTVTVRSSRTCDQAASGEAACLPAGERLPDVFFGTVRMQSVEPIAVVAQRISEDGPLADYRGFTVEEASRQIVLPVLNKNFGPWGGFNGWNSWFRVLTFDGSIARVHVVYFSKEFPDGVRDVRVIVDRQRTFRQWENRKLPDGWVGSAVIVADRPIVVVANLESDVFQGDPVMLYNGVSLE